MKITYGICLGPQHNKEYLQNLLDSIILQQQNIRDFEIIVVGNVKLPGYDVKIIPFNEEERPGWITKKKNIIAKEASYDNLCIVHDYVLFKSDWLDSVHFYDKVNPNWKVILNRVLNYEGTRHADWIVSPQRMEELINTDPERFTNMLMAAAPHENHPKYVAGLPYTVTDLSHIQYISGAFIFCKTHVLLANTFNENMIWGDAPGEDVEWSNRLSQVGILYHFNPYTSVILQKPGKWHSYQMPDEFVTELRRYYGSKPV